MCAVFSQPKTHAGTTSHSVAQTWLYLSQRSAGAERLFYKRAPSQTALRYSSVIMKQTVLFYTPTCGAT